MLPSHLSVALRFESFQKEMNCILYYTREAGPAPDKDTITGEADFFDTKFRAECTAIINPDCRYLGLKLRYITPTDDLEGYSTEDAATGSAVSDDVEPEEVAVVIQRRTSKPGRSKRGRIFVPYVPSDFLEGSSIVAVHRDKYVALAMEMEKLVVNTVTGASWRPCTPDWKNNLLEEVTHCRVDGEVKSRRDRRHPKRSIIYPAV